jgi:hypothetical protein
MADLQRRFGRGVSVDRQQFMQYEPIGDKLFDAFDKDRYAPSLSQRCSAPYIRARPLLP